MRHSLPIILCSSNEDFRSLIREMLGKNGFFHVLEAGNSPESRELVLGHSENALIIVHSELVDEEMTRALKKTRQFIIISQTDTDESIMRAALLGIEHVLSFPFSSRHLMEKIDQLI